MIECDPRSTRVMMMEPERGMPSVFADADALFDDHQFDNELSPEEEARMLTAMLYVWITLCSYHAWRLCWHVLCAGGSCGAGFGTTLKPCQHRHRVTAVSAPAFYSALDLCSYLLALAHLRAGWLPPLRSFASPVD
jgi:hypothetical protein